MPGVLRTIAEWNPLTAAATACRQLFGNPVGELPDVWPLQHPVTATLLWSVVIMVAFAPPAIRRYRRIGRWPAAQRATPSPPTGSSGGAGRFAIRSRASWP